MRRSLGLGVLLVMVMSSCGRAVERSEITGTWVITNESRQRLPTPLQKASASIALAANGFFVASEIPEDLLYGEKPAEQLVTGSGNWKLTSLDGTQQVQLNFNLITSGGPSQVPYGTQLNVSKGWASVSLIYFQGDPDEGRRIEFERK